MTPHDMPFKRGVLLFAWTVASVAMSCFCASALARPKKIVIATGDKFVPVVFRNVEGKPDGMHAELWRLWSEKTGIEVELRPMEWAGAIPALLESKVDAVDGVSYTVERFKSMDFSQPYGSFDTHIFFHNDVHGVRNLKDLAEFPVGIVKGTNVESYVREREPTLRLVPYVNHEEMVQAALDGGLRVFVGSEPMVSYFFAKSGKSHGFRRTQRSLLSSDLRAAVRKGDKALLAVIEEGLAAITPEERQRIERKWTGVAVGPLTSWQWLIWGGGGAGIAVALLATWNFLLRSRVAAATRTVAASERRYRAIVDDQVELVCRWHGDGILTFVNDAYCRYFGKTRAELVGASFRPLILEEDRAAADEHFAGLGPDSPVATHEHRAVRPDGEVRWQQWTSRAILDDTGEIIEYQGTGRDITERRQAEEALQESEEQYRTLVTNLNIGVYRATGGPHGQFLEANPAVVQMFGYDSVDEFMKIHVSDLYRDPASRASFVRSILRDGHVTDKELLLKKRDGTPIIASCTARIQFDEEGEIQWMDGVIEDVTDRKHAEEELLESEGRLRTFYEATFEGIVLTEKGRILDANSSFAATFGYGPGELIGQEVLTLVAPEDRELVTSRILSDYEKPYDHKAIRKDGSVIEVEVWGKGTQYQGRTCRITAVRDVTERMRAAEALRKSEEQYRSLVNNLNVGVYRTTAGLQGSFLEANPAFARMFGYSSPEEVMKRTVADFYADPADRESFIKEALEHGAVLDMEFRMKKKDGSLIWASSRAQVQYDEGGEALWFDGIVEDVTERRQLEEQLRQSQKMEAIGQLAGGIAHDFNNLLSAIMGFTELAATELEPGSPAVRDLKEVTRASERAALLTRQLLAFSRKQMLEPRVIDLTELIGNMEEMLRRLIRENVELVTKFGPDLGRVTADPGQMEQVIMNLAVNARDAMPDGGTLTIETKNMQLDGDHAHAHRDLRPGPYVMLTVTDTGVGMDHDTLSHAFEPFFTTKEVGEGTGLGLATVYGIVKQTRGGIEVDSEPGHGTTFNIFLPRIDTSAPHEQDEVDASMPGGSETVLLAEDEAAVRAVVARLLRGLGYAVLEAGDGAEALRLAQEHDGKIHLLLTDLIMPQMGGRELAEALVAQRPDTKIIFMSGYTDTFARTPLRKGEAFVQKPLRNADLMRMVRRILDR
jgi:PAS domain S-box-containing protein